MFQRLRSLFTPGRLSDEEFQSQRLKLLPNAPVPVVWLFGKTGSGKTSIIRYLTGAEDAQIGNGFRPQTQFSRQYDFPSTEEPVIRFLDTRGLGECRYDPAEDLRTFDASTHVVIVTVRAMDHALGEIVEPLKAIRAARPHRPIVLALTWLHEAYPGQQHPAPDPFSVDSSVQNSAEGNGEAVDAKNAPVPVQPAIPEDLARSLQLQRERFTGLVDRDVPVDFTRPEEGFAEPDFGGERLKTTLLDLLPAAHRSALLHYEEAMQPLRDLYERRAMPYVMGYASLAATAGAVPIPWIDIPIVLGIQSRLMYHVASLYGQPLNDRELQAIIAAMSGRVLARLALREAFKFIPIVGSAANAALAFAYTYALGKAGCWYFAEVRAGHAPRTDELERVWSEQIGAAANLWQRRQA